MKKVGDLYTVASNTSDNNSHVGVTYSEIEDLKKHWPGNKIPLSEPICGFTGEKCLKHKQEGNAIERYLYNLFKLRLNHTVPFLAIGCDSCNYLP